MYSMHRVMPYSNEYLTNEIPLKTYDRLLAFYYNKWCVWSGLCREHKSLPSLPFKQMTALYGFLLLVRNRSETILQFISWVYFNLGIIFFINSAITRMDCVENAVTSLELFEARTFSQQRLGKCEMKSCTCVFNTVVASNRSKSPSTALIATLTLRSCRNRPLGELTGSGNISRWCTQCNLKPKPFGFR